jgi:hypothetical protein
VGVTSQACNLRKPLGEWTWAVLVGNAVVLVLNKQYILTGCTCTHSRSVSLQEQVDTLWRAALSVLVVSGATLRAFLHSGCINTPARHSKGRPFLSYGTLRSLVRANGSEEVPLSREAILLKNIWTLKRHHLVACRDMETMLRLFGFLNVLSIDL